jgi:anti-sigma B factor antagonist
LEHELEEQQAEFGMRRTALSDHTALVELSGQIDLHTAPQLTAHLLSAIDDGAVNVVVDLTETTFIDSMTLGILLGAVKRLRPRGGQLQVVSADPSIRKIFEITLLDRVFALCETRDEALARAPSSG